MDEAMDTSSDSVEVADPPSSGTNEESGQNSAMDVSPVLDRRSIRSSPRVPSNVASSSRWIDISSFSTPTQEGTQHEDHPASSGGERGVSSTEQSSLQHLFPNLPSEAVADSNNLPPIGVTELITIHRPVLIDITSPVGQSEVSFDDALASRGEDISDIDSVNAIDLENDGDNNEPSTSQMQSVDIEGRDEPEALPEDLNPQATTNETMSPSQEEHGSTNFVPETSLNRAEPHDERQGAVHHDVENLPLAQRIRTPDTSPSKNSPPPKKIKQEELAVKLNDSDGEDEGRLCPICFDVWTNSGEHRLVSLRCGHLFGQQCIQHWLQIHKANDRRCPQCKKKASIKDLRQLYASKIRMLDTSELEQLKTAVKKLEEEKDRLTRELTYERHLNQEAVRVQHEQQLKLQQLQSQGFVSQLPQNQVPDTSRQSHASQMKINLLNRVEVSREGGCRVLAYNDWKGVLVASQFATNPLFPDFGIRVIDTEEFRLRQLIPLHTKAIRDLAFSEHRKDLLLSVSLDRAAKIFCLSSNTSVMTFNTEVPLWSCCWDGNNSNIFYAGSQNGIVLQYDVRNTHTEVSRIATQGDMAPVVSLSDVPAGDWLPRGGFFSCRLNHLRVYERVNSAEFKMFPLEIEGPFSALDYDRKSKCVLVTTRPTGQNPHAQYHLYQMGFAGSKPQSNKIHTLLGGTTQRVMSRPCQLHDVGNGKNSLICAYLESEAHIAVWSAASGQRIPAGTLPCSEPVMDLCSVRVNDRSFLASLSEKSLRVYELK